MAASRHSTNKPCTMDTAAWPTMQQMIALSLDRAEMGLVALIETRCADMDWHDADVEVDLAADLALNHIRQIRHKVFEDASEFDNEWYLARAAIALAAQAFDRPQSLSARHLKLLLQLFDEAPSFVEYAEHGPEG